MGVCFFLAYNRLYARKHVKRKCAQKHTCTHTEYLQRKSAIDREEKKEILRQKKADAFGFCIPKMHLLTERSLARGMFAHVSFYLFTLLIAWLACCAACTGKDAIA